MNERCGYAVTDSEGIDGPCDRQCVGWRWYQDCGHEDVLEEACSIHENEGGNRLHAAEVAVREARSLVGELRATMDRGGYNFGEPFVRSDLAFLAAILSVDVSTH